MGKIFSKHARPLFALSPLHLRWHLFFFFAAISVCLAQKEVRFERITVDHGLSQSSVSAITQDQYGYLWVATLDGLNRYDGLEFKIYRHSGSDPKSLHRNHVSKLHLDNNKTLWVCHAGVIARYNPHADNFDNFSLPENSIVHDLDNVSDSVLMLSTNTGIYEFNISTGSVITPEAYRDFSDQNIMNLFTVAGNTWVVTHYSVYRRAKNARPWSTIFTDRIGVRVYHDAPSGKIYLQTKTALYKFNEAKNDFEIIDQFNIKEDFDSYNFGMIKLSNGELWLFRKAIHIYNAEDQKITRISNIAQNPTSLSGDYLTCIFESNDQVVWVGTNGFGLNKYNPVLSIFKYVASYDATPLTLSNNFVYSVFTDDDNLIYVGTFSGVDILNLKQNQSEHYSMMGRDGLRARPQRIFKDRRGIIWLCTDKGLMHIKDRTVRPSGIMMLDTINIYDVAAASPDNYFLTTDRGVYIFDPNKLSSVRITPNGSIPIGVMDSTLWTESEFDITSIDPSDGNVLQTIKKNRNDREAFQPFPIKCFYQDSQGRRWIGSSGGGLSLFQNDGSFEYYDESDGLPNAVVYGILEDAHNNLWLSTNKGISVFNVEQRKSIRNFDKEDGLQGNEFNTKAFHKSPGGTFYFGGTNGLTFFDPDEAMGIRVEVPKTILSSFFINNALVDRVKGGDIYHPGENSEIVLENNERDFSFEIAGLGFSSPGRTQYKYMLENFNSDWVTIGNQRAISFTNIPPGEYTFRAKSANSFGEWEKDGLVIKVVVNGPFYNTIWFRSAMLMTLLISAYIYYRQRTAYLRARASYLESLVNDRTRKIQSMNDEIAAQNEELASQSESLSAQNDELTMIKASLEQMVDDRTLELQKLNSELIKQNSQLEQFAFITAHNIRGPVARIKGLLQFIPKSKMQELTYLECSVNDLDQVISDLSTILDVRYGHEKLFEPVQLKPIIIQTVRTIDDEIAKKGAVVDWKEFEDISVIGIPSYFNSIFYNLLHNAVKYADPTRPLVITIRTKRNAQTTYIEIEDNGLGIDMRYAKEKIFSLYQRFHPGIKGKGFGLFLVKTQVEAMSGSINVQSEVNKGTIFKIIVRST